MYLLPKLEDTCKGARLVRFRVVCTLAGAS